MQSLSGFHLPFSRNFIFRQGFLRSSEVFFCPLIKIGSLNNYEQYRFRSDFAPRRVKHRKAHKGRVPVRTGGSTKGNTVVYGDYGLRVKDGVRLSSSQLTAAWQAIKRKIKVIKGSQVWMRVFPDIPVTSKGNETRMGKGKGSFEYWACRVPLNKIVFEVGGGGIRREVAKDALRLASDKLPVKTEFVEARKVDIIQNI
ncbi:ribosomal protein L10e/L16 [Gigaspora rosea]|uniref:Ribosomal protein L10e/L16 n=1 Tax=Gigaspora rosea TaxID=44941 RepID=A0A397VH85_9GLOM|nr:ribosomal protein L10e/L16 [Gigaspora rosea]